MSEKEAWKYLADAWQKAVDEDCFGRPLAKCGKEGSGESCICDCISQMKWSGGISLSTAVDMWAKIDVEIEKNGLLHGEFLFPLTTDGGRQRAAFCLKMWSECA